MPLFWLTKANFAFYLTRLMNILFNAYLNIIIKSHSLLSARYYDITSKPKRHEIGRCYVYLKCI